MRKDHPHKRLKKYLDICMEANVFKTTFSEIGSEIGCSRDP